MTPAAVRAAISSVLCSLTGLAAERLFWANRPRGFTGPQYLVCRLRAPQAIGHDEVQYDYDVTAPVGAELTPAQTGLRSVTCQIQCHSHDATDTADAISLALSIQDGIQLPSHYATLAAADLAVTGVGGPYEIELKQDGRELSVVVMELRINALARAEGTAIGYVEHWGIAAELEMADGSTVTIPEELYP